MADREGQQFGNYRLIQLLGRGSFAEVYLGHHLHLDTQAAIKVLHAHLSSQDIEPFRSEARTLARLAHPHIIRVLDFGVEDGLPFLVMDYAPHGSLRHHHPKGERLALATVLSYVQHIAAALQYAHDQRLIHRDLKPENLLLGRHHEVLLSDFGLALIDQSSRQQQTPQTAGTIAYMAPEQLQGDPRPASDQYALGVVVYEWLCGERPFAGSFLEIAHQHMSVLPPSLREKIPTLPLTMEQVVLKALAKDPRHRFASVQDFVLALEAACKAASSSGQTVLMLSSEHPAAPGQPARHKLPAPLTPLIGREQEVATVAAMLQRSEVRLLTLTGTGGVGKTRLALQVATESLPDFADGVCFIPLAPISDPGLVISTIAQTFGVKEIAGRSFLDLLKADLQNKRLLLLLDNFEQVVTAAQPLTDLLTLCPDLKLLVTSRVTLHVQGEHEFPVPPLAVPDLKHLPESETLSHYAAVALFLQRAHAVKPSFQITPANTHAIAEICIRLDGLPLAIELAATRVKLLSPQALLSRLEHRLQVLTSGTQDAPTRQQTLRNTIAWSYNLLDTEEQLLFRWLSIFVNGCTLQEAEVVCTALDGGADHVLDGVASLIDKSLLQSLRQEGTEEMRLVMLETIREYGLEALAANKEMEITRRAHALCYLALAEEAEPRLTEAEQGIWLARLEREHDNLRAALHWLMEQAGGGEREMALRLGSALWRFWWMHGHVSEGKHVLERALIASEGIAAAVRAKALMALGVLTGMQGDLGQAEVLCRESLELFRDRGNTRGRVTSLWMLGYVALQKSDYAMASVLVEEALALSREVDDKWGIASSLEILAAVALNQGEYARARCLEEESLAFSREIGDTLGIAHALWLLALVIFFQGDYTRASALLEESLALCRQMGDKGGVAYALVILGYVALFQGEYMAARSLFEESRSLHREVGDRQGIAWGLYGLAGVARSQRDDVTARAMYEESLAILMEVNQQAFIALCLEGLADVVSVQGYLAWAARLWGAAEARRETIGTPMPPIMRIMYEPAVATARAQMSEKAFSIAWAEGRAMTLEQVLAAQGQETTPTPTLEGQSPYPDGLTAREVEVLRLVTQNLTYAQIAEHLVISPRTVNTHLTSIYSKIQVSSRSEATRYAIEHHLI